MSAYVVLDISVHDPEGYEDYKQLAARAIDAYGGKYLARGGRAETLEDGWQPNRIVILEFDSVDRAKQWYNSPEYRDGRALRHKTATTQAIIVEGL